MSDHYENAPEGAGNPFGGLEPAAVQIVESAPDAFVVVDDRGTIALIRHPS